MVESSPLRERVAEQDEHPQGGRDLRAEDGGDLERGQASQFLPGQLTRRADSNQRIHENGRVDNGHARSVGLSVGGHDFGG
ncbi:MAG TPA: hypothetical protein VKV73_32775 [Chloroflexota bacterium]|nr:hypothetical protein [Chloroflexota bacterium]